MTSRLREIVGYDYKDPAAWLRSMREIEPLIACSNLRYQARTLRTHELRVWGEARQAALFAFGMSRRLSEFAFDFAITQRQDYDAVVRWGNATNRMFTPVQLKEWVPNEVNPDASLANLIDKLEKYVDSPDLNVCFYLNRSARIDLRAFTPSHVQLGGLYVIASATPDGRYWYLIGDLLSPTWYKTIFEHP